MIVLFLIFYQLMFCYFDFMNIVTLNQNLLILCHKQHIDSLKQQFSITVDSSNELTKLMGIVLGDSFSTAVADSEIYKHTFTPQSVKRDIDGKFIWVYLKDGEEICKGKVEINKN